MTTRQLLEDDDPTLPRFDPVLALALGGENRGIKRAIVLREVCRGHQTLEALAKRLPFIPISEIAEIRQEGFDS